MRFRGVPPSGVTINDNIEMTARKCFVRCVSRRLATPRSWGEQADKLTFEIENERIEEMGGQPAEASPVLLGITKARWKPSFLVRGVLPGHHPRVDRSITLGKKDTFTALRKM